jgi:hypothetical protein
MIVRFRLEFILENSQKNMKLSSDSSNIRRFYFLRTAKIGKVIPEEDTRPRFWPG